MSGFKALNIESDDESDIEVDDSKEIQIEETLKLYQAALKYHSEGPRSFDKAAEAYRQLFESEIFHYPESQTELKRIELYGPSIDVEEAFLDVAAPTGYSSGNLETNNSTLPQILHLSHKNYAQFRLEALAANIETLNVNLRQILADATAALDHFVQALDKDSTDLDLWRRTATVGELLNSKRAARFCLEAVLEGDEEGLASLMTLPGLEDSMAGEQLRDLVVTLEDQLSILQAPLPTKKRRLLSKMLKQRLDPYHNIVSRQDSLLGDDENRHKELPRQERAMIPAPDSWAGLGDALLRHRTTNQYSSAPISVISFDLTDKAIEPEFLSANEMLAPSALPLVATKQVRFLPTTLAEQFPGMSAGTPTVQPRIADADPSMRSVSRPDETTDVEMTESSTVALPTRKRSGDAAGLVDGAEESRTKSRRTRGRESLLELTESKQPAIDANTQWEYEQQLNERKAADDWLYETVDTIFERVGVKGFEAGKDVRHELESSAETNDSSITPKLSDNPLAVARADFAAFLNTYSDRLAHLLLVGGENMNIGHSTSAAGPSPLGASVNSKPQVKFDTMPNDSLQPFMESVNHDWLSTAEVAYSFIKAMTLPGNRSTATSTYAKYRWPDALKTVIVRNMVNFDEQIFGSASLEFANFQQDRKADQSDSLNADNLSEMLLTIFELHLDVFWLVREPNSGVDPETVAEQGDRLQRWSNLARDMMRVRAISTPTQAASDQLNLRFLWATTFTLSASDDVDQDYALECMQDLRQVVLAAEDVAIYLPNNAVMPELSVAAIDRKLSELTTKDFFAKVTENELNDPAATIENLEPLLEALSARQAGAIENHDIEDQATTPVPQDLIGFLEGSSTSVKLMLWQRLRDAYATIDYQPMVVACYFRMMRMILDEVNNAGFLELDREDRQKLLLRSVRMLHVLMTKIFALYEKTTDMWECLDENGLQRAVTLLGDVLHILQVFNVYEDHIQIGQSNSPTGANDLVMPSFVLFTQAVHELQIQIWMILYSLHKEAIAQNCQAYELPDDSFDFLRCLHRNLSLRGICDGLNRKFVRMVKDEFFQMTGVDGYDQEQAQVLYDLYGLNCFMNPSYELIEHRCTHDAFLDKAVALQTVDLLLMQANKLPIKDLVKHSLKDTIEKVHGALSRKKPTEAILHNREIYRAYLRSAVRPVELYGCLKGDSVELMHKTVPESDAVLASKGWYFLMGHIALTRFRTTKKAGGSPQEDVDIAIAFFMQDLEYSVGNWQTWFRLAQAYDTKIDEMVMWSTDKMNNDMPTLVGLQRAAIHCYSMATALAVQSADATSETAEKLTELHYDFAMRIYNSSREPLSMRAFAVEETERFLSTNDGVVRGGSFKPLRPYTAFKFAKALFSRTLEHRSGQWMLHFMLGKCLWKMHSAPLETLQSNEQPPSAPKVFESFLRALELVPEKNSRDSKAQPILEPHYKLLVVVHKMYMRHSIDLEEAGMLLHNTPYAQSVTLPESREEWPLYVLTILKRLRVADKQNWHHRMIYRTAQIIHDFPTQVRDFIPRQCESEIKDPALLGPAGARHELTQQMFTKTMVLQVWRPDAERPGRHFVYTTQYTRFFVKILEDLQDRTSLEALARRVRRRNHELFEYTAVWQDICSAYLRILRKHASLSEGLETSTFSAIFHDEFLERKEPLERWMQAQENGENAALDVLRESQELKKINQGLVKPGPIDDLTGDAYAYLFQTIGKTLLDEEKRVKSEEAARNAPPPPPPPQAQEPAPPARNPTMSVMHLMNMDGASGTVTPDPVPTPVLQVPAAAVPEATAAAVPAVRRKIGVGRREIRNAAESCYPKTPAQTVSRVTGPVPESRVQVVINSSRPSLGGDMSVETSAPGSIHDSADDESELSELEEDDADDEDEEGDRKPLFPGLAGRERIGGEDSEMEVEGDETADDAEMGEAEGDDENVNEGTGEADQPNTNGEA